MRSIYRIFHVKNKSIISFENKKNLIYYTKSKISDKNFDSLFRRNFFVQLFQISHRVSSQHGSGAKKASELKKQNKKMKLNCIKEKLITYSLIGW